MRRLLRDPLTHFLILGVGALLFYEAVSGPPESGPQIVVTRADVERLRATWSSQWNRPPSDDELAGLLDSWVRQEILYREALSLGLDRDDTIVRRRLAQKMEFLAADRERGTQPGDAELDVYREQNAARFRVPGTVSFEQVYLSSDERGDAASADARAVLVSLRAGADPAGLGDRLLLPRRHDALSEHRIGQLFGESFARAVVAQEPGDWQGPLHSGYGLHLVRITNRVPPRDPALAEIRARVLSEWEATQRDERLAAFHRELRARYEVTYEAGAPSSEPPASP